MRLSVEWIKEYVPIDADAETIANSLTMAGLEVEEKAESSLGAVLDIKVTPNRGDCLSVIGVSRELSAAFKVELKSLPSSANNFEEPPGFVVKIAAPESCGRYAGRLIRNIRIAPSPKWMQDRLIAAGMRPINNVVDITNYVMLETGQPLHAFDFDTLKGGRIEVRHAVAGEVLTTLDGIERTLSPSMLVIADALRPVALAGVMGGAETEVGENTTTLLLESASFTPLVVRRAAKALDMRTEASYRFERGVDPQGVLLALDRASTLFAELEVGDVVWSGVDNVSELLSPRTLTLRTNRVCEMLGFHVPSDVIIDTLHRLGITAGVKHFEETLFVIPTWRPDLVREIDLVEEVGRILGYEHIPECLPHGNSTQGGDSKWGQFAEILRDVLTGAGIQEIVGHTLIAESEFEDPRTAEHRTAIRSALSAELSGLRRSLLPGLIDVVERNARRGSTPLHFFEIGHVFSKHTTQESVEYRETTSVAGVFAGPASTGNWRRVTRSNAIDFYDAKGIVDGVLKAANITHHTILASDDPRFHPGRSGTILVDGKIIGVIGELHPTLVSGLTVRERLIAFELDFDFLLQQKSQAKRFVPLSQYQGVVRDIAPRVSENLDFASITSTIATVQSSIIESINLTDIYTGPHVPEGTKSLTISFSLRSNTGTLTEEEVNSTMQQVRTALENNCGATFAA